MNRHPRSPQIRLCVWLLALAPWVGLDADGGVAVEFFDSSGQLIEGSVPVHGIAGALPGTDFVHSWIVPIDSGDGHPTGAARLEHLSIDIPVDHPGVALIGQLVNARALSRVVFHFLRGPANAEFFRVTVEDVAVVGVSGSFAPAPDDGLDPEAVLTVDLVYDVLELERLLVEQLLYIRGDTNNDLVLDLSDAINGLNHLFLGRTITCPASVDANGDGQRDLSDAVFSLLFLFQGGPPPPAPFPDCGPLDPGTPCESTACAAAR